MNRSSKLARIAAALVAAAAILVTAAWAAQEMQRRTSPLSIEDCLAQYGPAARARLQPHFAATSIAYPPKSITLYTIKSEKRLLVFAPDCDNRPRLIREYPILAASGGPGPKLREGDRQVPEGVYGIELLNPNSRFHLSLRVDYPNELDRTQAAAENRTNLGGDIMIHGGAASIGCLAMGDPAIEELFVLAADVGIKKITVLIAPTDFRDETKRVSSEEPWLRRRYDGLLSEVSKLR